MDTKWKAAGRVRNLRRRTLELGRALALAAALLTVGAVPSEAVPITHTFTPENPVADYLFGAYTFRLGFDQVFTAFEVTITDFLRTTAEISSRLGEVFGGFKCVEMGLSGGEVPRCVEFVATGYPTEPGFFAPGPGAVNLGIAYTIFGFPLPGHDPVDIGEVADFSSFISLFHDDIGYRLAHAPGSSLTFSNNATFQGNNGHCDTPSLDACAAEKGFNFGTPVPEPSGFLLLSSGLIGLACRRGLRKRRS